MGGHAAEVLIQRQLAGVRGCLARGQRDAQDGVGAQLAFVLRAIEADHHLVEFPLADGIEADDLGADLGVHVLDGLEHALAQVAALVAVAQLNGLVFTRGGSRGHGGSAPGAARKLHLHLDGGVAARVQDLPGLY